jgi:hypothetical protein
MREKADVIHEMGRGEALVGTLRVTVFALIASNQCHARKKPARGAGANTQGDDVG